MVFRVLSMFLALSSFMLFIYFIDFLDVSYLFCNKLLFFNFTIDLDRCLSIKDVKKSIFVCSFGVISFT